MNEGPIPSPPASDRRGAQCPAAVAGGYRSLILERQRSSTTKLTPRSGTVNSREAKSQFEIGSVSEEHMKSKKIKNKVKKTRYLGMVASRCLELVEFLKGFSEEGQNGRIVK